MAKKPVKLVELLRWMTEPGSTRRRASSGFYYDSNDDQVHWPTDRIKLIGTQVDCTDRLSIDLLRQKDLAERLCAATRNRRRVRFGQVAGNRKYTGPYIVEAGDSWFLYPILLNDVVDILVNDNKKPLAIWSTGCAGNTVQDTYNEKDHRHHYMEALTYDVKNADIFMLCGAGNDLLGGGNLYNLLVNYTPGMKPRETINTSNLEAELDIVLSLYTAIVRELELKFPELKTLIHGYDYPWSMNDIWIGKPMNRRGIPKDAKFRRAVGKQVIDALNVRLEKFEGKHSRVSYLDLRKTLRKKSEWFDEIHPTSKGFQKIAAKFRKKIAKM